MLGMATNTTTPQLTPPFTAGSLPTEVELSAAVASMDITSPFLKLPAEIRDAIYDHLLVREPMIRSNNSALMLQPDFLLDTNVLLVCRQIEKEYRSRMPKEAHLSMYNRLVRFRHKEKNHTSTVLFPLLGESDSNDVRVPDTFKLDNVALPEVVRSCTSVEIRIGHPAA